MRGDEGIAPYKDVYKQNNKLQFNPRCFFMQRGVLLILLPAVPG